MGYFQKEKRKKERKKKEEEEKEEEKKTEKKKKKKGKKKKKKKREKKKKEEKVLRRIEYKIKTQRLIGHKYFEFTIMVHSKVFWSPFTFGRQSRAPAPRVTNSRVSRFIPRAHT